MPSIIQKIDDATDKLKNTEISNGVKNGPQNRPNISLNTMNRRRKIKMQNWSGQTSVRPCEKITTHIR